MQEAIPWASPPKGKERGWWWKDWVQLPRPGVGLALVVMLTLWEEESWEPVPHREPSQEISLFIHRTSGVRGKRWNSTLPSRDKSHVPIGGQAPVGWLTPGNCVRSCDAAIPPAPRSFLLSFPSPPLPSSGALSWTGAPLWPQSWGDRPAGDSSEFGQRGLRFQQEPWGPFPGADLSGATAPTRRCPLVAAQPDAQAGEPDFPGTNLGPSAFWWWDLGRVASNACASVPSPLK